MLRRMILMTLAICLFASPAITAPLHDAARLENQPPYPLC